MWLTSDQLSVRHGFSTRHGGVSQEPFASLNFDDRQDDPAKVSQNRMLALCALGFDPQNVARLNQVHSCEVVLARVGVQTADALVSRETGLVLAIGTADCYPILFHDPVAGVVGAAHAGWKGTLGRIALHTVQAMQELGASVENLQVAIGPGISGREYPVGNEVAMQFLQQGFSRSCVPEGKRLDLLEANLSVLEAVWSEQGSGGQDRKVLYRNGLLFLPQGWRNHWPHVVSDWTVRRFFRPLRPSFMVGDVTELSPEFLNEWNIRGLILDLDNTLVPYKSNETRPEIQEWVKHMHAHDVKLYMVSNALHQRVEYWVREFLFPGVGLAAKPFPKFFRQALSELDLPTAEVAMVGDQLFTDVLGGNLVGMRTVMVRPLSDNALPHTRVTRKLERLVLHLLKENSR